MPAGVRRLAVGLLVAAAITVLHASPAAACSLALTPLAVNGTPVDSGAAPLTVRPGERLHLQGTGFYEVVPVSERPSTTTTTVMDGGVVADCPPTRPAREVRVAFHQEGREARELATVDGSTIDLEVVIPADAVVGPARLQAGSSGPVELSVVAGATVTTRPDGLPRTGSSIGWAASVGSLLVLGGVTLVLASRRRRDASGAVLDVTRIMGVRE